MTLITTDFASHLIDKLSYRHFYGRLNKRADRKDFRGCTNKPLRQKKKPKTILANQSSRFRFSLVGTVRLELMTSCMSSMRSNQLSYAPERIIFYHSRPRKSSLSGRILKVKNSRGKFFFSIDFCPACCYNQRRSAEKISASKAAKR